MKEWRCPLGHYSWTQEGEGEYSCPHLDEQGVCDLPLELVRGI